MSVSLYIDFSFLFFAECFNIKYILIYIFFNIQYNKIKKQGKDDFYAKIYKLL